MISVGGNHYSVPDTIRRRTFEVQHHMTELQIFEDDNLVACHPVIEGTKQRRVDTSHRKAPPIRAPKPPEPLGVGRSPLGFYGAVGRRLATGAVS
ncbi:Mu transposase domain-containing protein [Tritonibacter mobilis]|uniref:Mu transposase domain-containing protein n=1 Tax=Tritonibacter mobilis TaxID=379347 RepID=UPI00387EB962